MGESYPGGIAGMVELGRDAQTRWALIRSLTAA